MIIAKYLCSGLFTKIIWKGIILDGFLTLDSYENSLAKLAFSNMAKHGNMVKFSTLSLKAEISYGVTSSCNIVFNLIRHVVGGC